MKGITPAGDLIDAKSGEVVAKGGEKINARKARELGEKGLKEILITTEDLAGRYLAEDIVDMATRPRSGAKRAPKSMPRLIERLCKRPRSRNSASLTSTTSRSARLFATRSTSTRTQSKAQR